MHSFEGAHKPPWKGFSRAVNLGVAAYPHSGLCGKGDVSDSAETQVDLPPLSAWPAGGHSDNLGSPGIFSATLRGALCSTGAAQAWGWLE